MKDYIFFWGCTIPGRFPFLEKSLRLVLGELGVRFREIEGFTCCPEKYLVETLSEEAWYLTAARNLALAEAAGGDLLVACNGCYATFRSAISAFAASSALRAQVAERLASVGLSYSFRSSVHHLVEVLHDGIGPEVIARRVLKPLEGLRIATHTGCQLMRPSPTVRVDDPSRPEKLDRLVSALGAESLDYNTKLLCCGEALGRSGNQAESLANARVKILELEQIETDAMAVVCPACFGQYETQQVVMGKEREEPGIPVFYITELLGLALGFTAEEMGLDMHRVDTAPFFERWSELRRMRELVPPEFDYGAMKTCVGCESCSNDCPVTQVDESFSAHQVIRDILAGDLEEVLAGDEIWKCLECGTCTELCPNYFGMVKVFKEAKRMAIARGCAPAETAQGIDMFCSRGVLGKTRERARAKLGLGPVSEAGSEQLARLLSGTLGVKDEEE
ncbi:MAG: 4Fe-4S dicluster domain-containing protein [Actinobacteria bacterium]|nr:4Fe-4S dicluster domain-containing protein [Actinomycetota bacterium]MBU1943894.1 4Fe-4S dicluster domain-containing protein [Actinomycetota bacterium]MBU2688584.1 4Fe-4S dicluster domain-containing protein [Actinomycetota bacterium]